MLIRLTSKNKTLIPFSVFLILFSSLAALYSYNKESSRYVKKQSDSLWDFSGEVKILDDTARGHSTLVFSCLEESGVASRSLAKRNVNETRYYDFQIRGNDADEVLINIDGAVFSINQWEGRMVLGIYNPKLELEPWNMVEVGRTNHWLNVSIIDEGNSWNLMVDDELIVTGIGYMNESHGSNEMTILGNEEGDFYLKNFQIRNDITSPLPKLYSSNKARNL